MEYIGIPGYKEASKDVKLTRDSIVMRLKCATFEKARKAFYQTKK